MRAARSSMKADETAAPLNPAIDPHRRAPTPRIPPRGINDSNLSLRD